jgi:hypothetical protein
MLDHPIYRNQVRTGTTYSTFSRPSLHSEGTYEIHLVKSDDPDYIPADMELWPMYHSAILGALHKFPEAHRAATAAFTNLQQQVKGKENLHLPKGTGKF